MNDPSTPEPKIVVDNLKQNPQEIATSVSKNDAEKKPETQSSSGIKWTEVFGLSPTEKVRSRLEAPQKREIPQQLVDLSKQNIFDAVMITTNAVKANVDLRGNPLWLVSGMIKNIDSTIDFDNPQNIDTQKVSAAIEKLFEVNSSQAISLGLVIQEYKLSLLKEHYQIDFKQVEEGKKPQEAIGPRRVGEMTIDPVTGNLVFNERPMSYEEFIQTSEGQREKRFWFLKWKSPATKEEFDQMFQSEEGKPGKYKLIINKIDQENKKYERQIGQIAEQTFQKQLTPEDFILQQLDLLDLDPQNLTDFRWLWQEIQLTTLMRAEIIRATGGDPSTVENLLGENIQLPEIFKRSQIGEVTQAITKAIEAARTAQANKTKQELEALRQQKTETSFRNQLEQRKKEIDEILEKKREEEKVRGTEINKQRLKAGTDIINLLIENLEKQGFNLGKNGDILLQLAGLKEGRSLAVLRAEAKRIERQLGIENGESKVINQLRQKIDTLEEILRMPETVIQTGNQRIIRKADVDEVKAQLKEYKDKLMTYEVKFNVWANLSYWESIFEAPVEINGQRKTVKDWLEEARKIENKEGKEDQKEEGKSDYEKMEVPQLETELSRINVVLDYFDEKSLIARNERAARMSTVAETDLQGFYDLAQIQSLNPDLYQILIKAFPETQNQNRLRVIKNELPRKKLLFVLEQAFGEEFIFPPDRSTQTYKDVIAFLELELVDLRDVKSLKDFDELMKRVRIEVNNPRLEEKVMSQSQVNQEKS